jgi:hypothetical protein
LAVGAMGGSQAMNLFPWFLFAHVLGAIIAFGPTFSSPIIARLGAAEREHGNFAVRVGYALARVQVWPFALLQGITGVGLVITGNIDVLKLPWLMVSIVLYLVALGFSYFVQMPTAKRIIELTTPPPGGPSGGPPAGGPPPELARLITRVRRGGMLLAALVITIVALMVLKPQL